MKRTRLAAIALLLSPTVSFAWDGDQTDWVDLGGALAGSQGDPELTGSGDPLPGGAVTLELSSAAATAPAFLVVGVSQLGIPFFGGTLVPDPQVILAPALTDGSGELTLQTAWPPLAPSGIPIFYQYWVVDPGGPFGAAASNGLSSAPSTGPAGGVFPDKWQDGTDCATETDVQVHAYNQDTYILRQSLCTSFEAPFIYLFFGQDKVLMLDSGDGGIPIDTIVYGIIQDWLAAKGMSSIELVVAHTHAHGDHVAGDPLFQGQPNTTVVGTSVSAVQSFFGIASWPTQIVTYDLGGGRVIDVIPIPGHEASHLAFYDRQTAIAVTGDSLYPGRLYVFGAVSGGNWPIYQESMQRLVAFLDDKPVCWVLGTHVEMTDQAGIDFPIGAAAHPNERELQLVRDHLIELRDAIYAMGGTPVVETHDDFIIFPIG